MQSLTLTRKWFQYLIERFSLFVFLPSAILHNFFLFSYIAPHFFQEHSWLFCVGTLTYIGLFLILRLSDELKDKTHDDQFYPDRPVQRGLLSLADIRRGLVIVIFIITILNFSARSVPVMAILISVGIYMVLMRFEFFVPHILRPRILLYLVTHQVFVFLFFFYYFALARKPLTSYQDVLFIFGNLLIVVALEVARKIRTTSTENSSRDTYSAALGRPGASFLLFCILLVTGSIFVWIKVVPLIAITLILLPVLAMSTYLFLDRRWTAHSILGSTVAVIAFWMVWAL